MAAGANKEAREYLVGCGVIGRGGEVFMRYMRIMSPCVHRVEITRMA